MVSRKKVSTTGEVVNMNQEYVSKSACKDCEHLEHVEGTLLSESEYACKASILDTVPEGCDTFGPKPAVRVINMEITSCTGCPYVFKNRANSLMTCTKTHDTLVAPATAVPPSKRPIPDSCPLEVKS